LDDQALELIDSKVGTYAICGKFKSLNDDFVWGLIGVYGPNYDNLRFALFDELKFFMSQWDIRWCLGGDFNVVRSPHKRSSEGWLSSLMLEFSDFINVCGFIDPPLEGGGATLGLAMWLFRFCLALIFFSSPLSGKTIFKECIKLFSPRLRHIIFLFFLEREHPMLLNTISYLKMFGLRWMALVTLLKLSGMIVIYLDLRVLSWPKN